MAAESAEAMQRQLRRQHERLEGSDFREAVKAARLLRRAREEGSEELAEEARALENALETRFPAWRAEVPPHPSPREEAVREWARKEVLAWMREMERALEQRFRTLAETDVKIIRELRRLREVPARGRVPM